MTALSNFEARLAVIARSIRPKPQRRRKDGTLIPVRTYSWTPMTYRGIARQEEYIQALRERHRGLWLISVCQVVKHPKQRITFELRAPYESRIVPRSKLREMHSILPPPLRNVELVTSEECDEALKLVFPNAEPRGAGAILTDPGDLVKLHMLERVE